MTDDGHCEAACDYCGLPLGTSAAATVSPQYCCVGCRFAASVAQESGDSGQIRWTLTKLGVSIFFTMNVMVFTMALWTRDVYEPGSEGSQAELLHQLFRYLCLIFASPVLLLLGGPLLESTWEDLRQRRLTTDLLLIIGVAAAYIYSVAAVIQGSGHVYFEVGCMVLVAVTLGRWLEATGKLKTTEALQSLARLLPDQVRLILDGTAEQVAIESVNPGDRLRVLASERIPVDGVILKNEASIDEQVLTGESQPALKQTGDEVLGGTLNLDGDLLIEVKSRVDEGTLRSLMDAVRAAAAAKGKYQRLADRIARLFLPAVFFVALATFGFHFWRDGFQAGLLASLAVVLIACPCALGLATPMAIWAALGRASREQVLFRSGDAICRLAEISAICFDKTGTLTTGEPMVAQFHGDHQTDHIETITRAASLASTSVHGLSSAIRRYAIESMGIDDRSFCELRDARNLAGLGVRAIDARDDTEMFLGSPRLMEDAGLSFSDELRQQMNPAREDGSPISCIGWRGRVRGVIVFREQIRSEARAALEELRRDGFGLVILTGDEAARASKIGDELNVEVAAGMLPEDKQAAIGKMRARYGAVAMVGDGVNDAPAVAAADVGVAMGCGTDVLRQTADACLLGNDLSRLSWTIALARRTVKTIRQNLFWAFTYNTIGIALAATGWLNPIFAAIAMAVSSFFVVSNSLRLGAKQEPSIATEVV